MRAFDADDYVPVKQSHDANRLRNETAKEISCEYMSGILIDQDRAKRND